MRHSLVAKLLGLFVSLLFFHHCHAFYPPFNHVESKKIYLRTCTVRGHSMTWIPRGMNFFILNESDQHGADISGKSTTGMHRVFLQRWFSFFKYPVAVLKYLRHLGIQTMNRSIEKARIINNAASDVTVEWPTHAYTASEMINCHLSDAVPLADRWAHSAPHVNFTGLWDIIVSDGFRKEYDVYLRNLGQPYIVRSVALSIVDRTVEETLQTDGGRSLLLRSINARGVWERTLVASGTSPIYDSSVVHTTVLTIDKEPVQADAWWERNGTVHHSWLRGVTKYGGGDFESVRYLVGDDSILVCESTFHPSNCKRDPAHIQWRFRRRF